MTTDALSSQAPLGDPYAAVAARLGCSVDFVRKLVREGRLDVVRLSARKVLVTRESVERFVRERAS